MADFASVIKRLRIERGITQEQLASMLKVSRSTIGMYETGSREPDFETCEAIADIFNVDMDYLLGRSIFERKDPVLPSNAIPVGPGQQIPILGSVRCGQPMYAEGNIDGYVPYIGNSGENYFALRAVGDSMNAAGINEGDLVIVRQQDSVDPNTIAVVCVNGDEATLKRFRQDGNTVFLMPQSTNPNHQIQVYDITRTPVHIIGRVMEIRKQL